MKEMNEKDLELVTGGAGEQGFGKYQNEFKSYWEQKKKKDRRSPLWRLVMDDYYYRWSVNGYKPEYQTYIDELEKKNRY
ncbi:MAG: hypothetical protein J5449_09445 [Oscillospiraceae bacterium]|nr:hypothetical protein [Oscillospiraceae bacterium]